MQGFLRKSDNLPSYSPEELSDSNIAHHLSVAQALVWTRDTMRKHKTSNYGASKDYG
jgi:hypothetical protein